MTSTYSHSEDPLTAEEWKELNEVVVSTARKILVGRRFIELHGPLGAGVQTIIHDHFTGTTRGNLGIMGEEESDSLRSVRREAGIVPLLYKDFVIHWRDLETSRFTGAPFDSSIAAGAAAFCANREDELIFHGDNKLGYEGLMTVEGRRHMKMRDWSKSGNAFQDVVDATTTLVDTGYAGPKAMVVHPKLYAQLHRVHEGTGVLEIRNVRELLTDGVYQSSCLKEGTGVIVATGKQHFDLAVGQDFSLAYLGADKMNHPFRVFEAIYLRIKRHDAICTLSAK